MLQGRNCGCGTGEAGGQQGERDEDEESPVPDFSEPEQGASRQNRRDSDGREDVCCVRREDGEPQGHEEADPENGRFRGSAAGFEAGEAAAQDFRPVTAEDHQDGREGTQGVEAQGIAGN